MIDNSAGGNVPEISTKPYQPAGITDKTAQNVAAPADLIAPVKIIQARSNWRGIDFKELYAYRDLYFFLTLRGIKVQYAQSALGVGWAIIQPLFQMVIFTVVFGYLAKVSSEGAPYALFSMVALIPWAYFSSAITEGSNSLLSNTKMLTKVYFPRLIMPLSSVTAKLLDFMIALGMLFLLMVIYRRLPTWNLVWLPALVILMVLTAAGIASWLTALAIQYRDIKYGLGFLVQLLMYATPVIYSTYSIPATYHLGNLHPWLEGIMIWPRQIYALNPMVGVIEGFRSMFLGTHPMPWNLIGTGALSSALIAITGCMYFRNRERLFADVA